MSGIPILALVDAQDLRARGLLHPNSIDGANRLHRRLVNGDSDEEYKHISLDVPLSSPLADKAYVTIPEMLISHQTLKYLGLSDSKAAVLWDKWCHWDLESGIGRYMIDENCNMEIEFIDFAVHHTARHTPDVDDESDDAQWRTYIKDCGISEEVENAIMDPDFTSLRLSCSGFYWIEDTMRMRYAGLEEIQRTSFVREEKGSHVNQEDKGRQQESGQGNHQASNTSQAQQQPLGQGQSSYASNTIQVSVRDVSASAMAARNAPGHTILFKAIDKGRIHGLFNDTGTLSNVTKLASFPPTDFSGTNSCFYFTPSYAIAKQYAQYAKGRVTCESVVIVCFRIRNAAIESLSDTAIQRIYWPSPEWKQLIWYCRRGKPFPSHSQLGKFRNALLIIGTISTKPNSSYERLASWEKVLESHVLQIDDQQQQQQQQQPRSGIQYVFPVSAEGEAYLLESGLQESIKVFPFHNPLYQIEAWIAESSSLV